MAVKKIVVHYEDGTEKTIDEGLTMYVVDQVDAQAEFVGLTEENQLAMINALMVSLDEARKQIKLFEQKELQADKS